ncbi:MAG: tetratricopeptide repeat protein [Gammaproteobacteria bacterium]|jgi:predicted Zn-dependent protease|nr:tetratricopeptide repeat protein [Gammaproteobacteria bacterium]
MGLIENLEAMLARGQDSALLRFSLGGALHKAEDHERAVVHLAKAVAYDPGYSAAWKLYGRALAALGRDRDALAAFDTGIATAEGKGDMQAAKEMRVFRKRVAKQLGEGA